MAAAATAFRPAEYDADAQLMIRVREGDIAAFETLLQKHRAAVIYFLTNIVRDRAIAEELSQEVFLRLYLNRERYQPSAKFTSWMYLIARHRALNWVRDHGREHEIERLDSPRTGKRACQVRDSKADVTESLQRKMRAEGVWRAVDSLPERQRTVVIMSKYTGDDCMAIAREMQCTHQAVRSLLFRAYATLRQTLDPREL